MGLTGLDAAGCPLRVSSMLVASLNSLGVSFPRRMSASTMARTCTGPC